MAIEEEFYLHKHTGTETPKVSLKHIKDLIEVVDAIPTSKPKHLYEQVKLFVTGTDATVCIYDYSNQAWKTFGTGSQTVGTHASTHSDGAGDEINATNLDGTASKVLTTQGDILYEGASGLARLGAGTSGQFLKTQGASANPTWAAGEAGEGHVTIVPLSYTGSDQGTFAWVGNTSSAMGGYISNYDDGNAADEDDIQFKAYLVAGTYTVRLVAFKSASSAIVDIDIDGTEVASFDLYAASDTPNQLMNDTGNVISTSGIKTIKVRVDGRNASADDWLCTFHYLVLYRTA